MLKLSSGKILVKEFINTIKIEKGEQQTNCEAYENVVFAEVVNLGADVTSITKLDIHNKSIVACYPDSCASIRIDQNHYFIIDASCVLACFS